MLADFTAVIVAVAIDANVAVSLGSEPIDAPEPEPQSDPPPPTLERDKRELPRAGPTGFVRAALGGGLGRFPRLSALVGLAGGVEYRAMRAELRASYWLPQRVLLDEASSPAGAVLQLWSVGVRACGVPSRAPVSFPLCVGGQGGLMHGEAFGVSHPRRDRATWLALDASAAIRVAITPIVGWWLETGLSVALSRPGFVFDAELGRVHRSGTLGLAAATGLEVRFP